MSDESHINIPVKKETINSSSNEDNYSLDNSSSSSQQDTCLTTDNDFGDQSNQFENHSENIQTSNYSSKENESIEDTQSNIGQDSFDQNQNPYQHFNIANNQDHTNFSAVEQLVSNIRHQPDHFRSVEFILLIIFFSKRYFLRVRLVIRNSYQSK
ncbi:unnamed protein product [Rotaria sp. Silwood2]|nr:unnamed protein product [Rotaria sp. Silwood2]